MIECLFFMVKVRLAVDAFALLINVGAKIDMSIELTKYTIKKLSTI